MIDSPEAFPRAFAAAFGARDSVFLAGLMMPKAGLLTLTGHWAEGPDQACEVWQADFDGPLAQARLVTGRAALSPIGPGAAVVNQRYIVTGAQDSQGAELPRIAAVLMTTLAATPEGWRALSLCLAPLG